MKLIKINQDHYVIVDDSEIKEGDWTYHHVKGVYKAKVDGAYTNQKKITHSTQPIDGDGTGACFIDIKQLSLQEVKELIGEVDVEKKAEEYFGTLGTDEEYHGFKCGYNQALEDNKEKKWTDEDVIYFVNKSRETGLTAEYLMLTKQLKTEWEVELIGGQLKLKQ